MRVMMGCLACLPLIAGAGAASAGNSRLEALFNNQPNGPVANLCYVRHYDKAHLAAHPKQNATDMLVYFARKNGEEAGNFYYIFGGQVKFRDSGKAYTFDGNCDPTPGKQGLSIGCGIDCDGGGFSVDARDDQSAAVRIDAGLRLGEPDDDQPLGTKGFDGDDQTFLLRQTALKDCLPVIYDEDVKAAITKGAITQ
jgi:hypothetical protein